MGFIVILLTAMLIAGPVGSVGGPTIQTVGPTTSTFIADAAFSDITYDAVTAGAVTDHTVQIDASAQGGTIDPLAGNLLVQFTALDSDTTPTEAGLTCDSSGEVWTKVLAKAGNSEEVYALVCYRVSTGGETSMDFAFDGGMTKQSQSIILEISGAKSLSCAAAGTGFNPNPVIPAGTAGAKDLTLHFVAADGQAITESDSSAAMTSCTAGQMTVRESANTSAGVTAAACAVSLGDTDTDTWTGLLSGSEQWIGINCWASP